MIMKSLKKSMSLLSFSCRHQFGVLLIDERYAQYDIRIKDIDADDLNGVISQKLGKKYLSPLSLEEQEFEKIRKGIIYGKNCRGLISLPTRFQDKTLIWVHYLLATGSPYTFLGDSALQTLMGVKKLEGQDINTVRVNGAQIEVRVSTPHFGDFNIIGMDYINKAQSLKYEQDYLSLQFK